MDLDTKHNILIYSIQFVSLLKARKEYFWLNRNHWFINSVCSVFYYINFFIII